MSEANKYIRHLNYWDESGKKHELLFDVYDVIVAYKIGCPATAHAIKKLLCAGQRGHKDRLTDLREAAAAIERAIELSPGKADGHERNS